MTREAQPPALVDLPPEIEVMLRCARPQIAADDVSRVRALLAGPVEWGAVITAAVSQDVLSLVYRNLTTVCGETIPDEIRRALDRYVERNARRNAGLARDLAAVFQLLEARAIPALPFKGCVLAAAAYGDPALREFHDLDFLIDRSDALRAKDALIEAGYRLDTGVKLNGFPAHGYEYRFIRNRDGLTVEVCWRITLRHSFASLDLDRLHGGGALPLAGVVVPTLGPEEQVLLVCVHGSKHVWGLLRWVCDVAALVHRYPEMDWDRVQQQASQVGCWRAVALGLRLAHGLLGASLPAPILGTIAREPGIAQAERMVRHHLFRGDGGVGTKTEIRLELYLAERLCDRVWIRCFPILHFLYDLVTPSERDRTALRVPAWLTGIYYATRPVRLLMHYGCLPVRKALAGRGLPGPR